MTEHVALCPHLSVEHFRGGEKWVVELANRLVEEESVTVSVHALPYAPDGERRVDVYDVLDSRVSYTEAWCHDLSGVDTAYVFYHPGARLSFRGANNYIAGIHSWAYVSPHLFESHYGTIETGVKFLYRAIGQHDLKFYDTVHTVTPAFECSHSDVRYIPNFVDTNHYHPDRADLNDDFTVFVSAAHIPEKGWDLAKEVAELLPEDISIVSTGESDSEHIEGLGFLSEEELAEVYSQAHVVLHPARVDTDSMVINEACASGTPTITTPLITHVRESEGVIHAGTPKEMTQQILQLQQEWQVSPDGAYAARCQDAQSQSRTRSDAMVVPQLVSLLTDNISTDQRTTNASSDSLHTVSN